MKAVIISALLGLGVSLNLRGVADDAHKVAEFVEKHQKAIENIVDLGFKEAQSLSEDDIAHIGDLITDGINMVGDLNEDQLFHLKKGLKKVGHFISQNHKTIEDVAAVAAETELFNLKKDADKVGKFVNKNKGAVESGVKTITDVAYGNYQGAVDNGINTITDATHQNELFNLKKDADKVGKFVKKNKGAIESGVKTITDVANGNFQGAVDNGIDTITDATHQDELFNLKKAAHKVGHFISKNHKTIEDVAAVAAETELFNLKKDADKVGKFVNKNKGAIESGVKTVTDVVDGNYQGAIDNGVNTITDATHQDELFNLKNEANKVGKFVKKNKGTIESGVKTVSDVANGNYQGAVDNGIDTITDATHQNELFNLKKDAHKVGHFISKNHKTIEDVAAVAAETGLFNLKKDADKVGKFVNKNKGAIESGVKTVTDVADGNYQGAIDNGVNTITDATHQDELFNLKKAAHKVGHFISKNHKTIEDGAQIAAAAGIL